MSNFPLKNVSIRRMKKGEVEITRLRYSKLEKIAYKIEERPNNL